jgi:hypothetical protein
MGDDDPSRHGAAGQLIGRDQDLGFIRSFVDRAAAGGGALLLSGDPGIGKTVLLDAAAAHATAAGTQVLRVDGAEFEAGMSFAGLNQLLYPLFDGIGQLSPVHGRALSIAVGLNDGPGSSPRTGWGRRASSSAAACPDMSFGRLTMRRRRPCWPIVSLPWRRGCGSACWPRRKAARWPCWSCRWR